MKTKRLRLAAAAILAVSILSFALWHFLGREFLYAGTIEVTEVDVSARVSSVIERVEVREGQQVEAGQSLLKLACEDIRLAADLAKSNYDRARQLAKQGSLSQADFDRAKYQYEDAVLRKAWCDVAAPGKGTVLSIYREAGELVGPGTKLLTLGDLSEAWAYIYVGQALLASLKLGQEVEGVLPEMPGRTFKGRIAHIRDEAEFTPRNVQTRDERSRLVYGIKTAFSNPDGILKPGMTIEVRLPVQ